LCDAGTLTRLWRLCHCAALHRSLLNLDGDDVARFAASAAAAAHSSSGGGGGTPAHDAPGVYDPRSTMELCLAAAAAAVETPGVAIETQCSIAAVALACASLVATNPGARLLLLRRRRRRRRRGAHCRF
jgi:hypothetical protein